MKKKISLMLAVLLALTFAGCGEKAQKVSEEKKAQDLSRPAKAQEEVLNTDNKTEENTPQEKPEEETNTEPVSEETAEKAADVNLSEVRTAILSSLGITDSMMLETDALTRLYAIDASKVKQSASFVTMSGTFPHEIIMVEAVDEKVADEIVSLLNNRLSEVMVQSKSYDAENYALAQKCRVLKNGNYISLFLSPEFEKMLSVYEGYIK